VVLDFGKSVMKCVKTTSQLQFIFTLFQEFGRYMNLSKKRNANFFLCNYSYNYSEVYVSLGYIF
jgi:hypothetical protein